MNMNAKHTPGPWHVELKTHILDANRTLIANVCDRYDGTNNNFLSSAEANACLISEAPELLACLLDVLDADGDLYAMDFDRYRAAIAKATGENQ